MAIGTNLPPLGGDLPVLCPADTLVMDLDFLLFPPDFPGDFWGLGIAMYVILSAELLTENGCNDQLVDLSSRMCVKPSRGFVFQRQQTETFLGIKFKPFFNEVHSSFLRDFVVCMLCGLDFVDLKIKFQGTEKPSGSFFSIELRMRLRFSRAATLCIFAEAV